MGFSEPESSYASQDNGVGGVNGLYLIPMYVQGNAAFFSSLAKAVVGAGLDDTVFAYDLVNEGEFDMNEPPLSRTSGSFVAPNGAAYDMASVNEKNV